MKEDAGRCPMGRFHVVGLWEGIAVSVQQCESVQIVQQDQQTEGLVDVELVVVGEQLGRFVPVVGLVNLLRPSSN